MNLILLVTLAISIPLLIVLASLSFTKSLSWFAGHPKSIAVVAGALAVYHWCASIWEARDAFGVAAVVQAFCGILWVAIAGYHWFRGKPQLVN